MPSDPFAAIIGHDRALTALRRMAESGRLAHAFLFVGPEGVGRRTVAHAFLQALMPEAPLAAHPDFLEVVRGEDEKTGKRKSAVSVEQVRALRDRLSLSAPGFKAALIEEADAMNAAAGNALLKTLEEPSGRTVIVLRAPSVDSVPATVASRCQVLRFHPVPSTAISEALRRRGLDQEEAASLAQGAAGSPGRALRLLKDGEYRSASELATSVCRSLIGASVPVRLRTVAECLPKDEANKAEAALRLLGGWEEVLRGKALEALAQGAGTARWTAALQAVRESAEAVRRNGNPQLALEHAALKM